MLLLLDRLIKQLVSVAFFGAVAAMLCIMVIGSADVVGVALSAPVPAALEAQETLLAVSIFLAIAHAQRRGEHIAVDLILTQLSDRTRRHLKLLPLICGVFACAIIGARTWTLAMSSLNVSETANAIVAFPIYPAKFLVSIGAWIATMEFLRQLAWWCVGKEAIEADVPAPIE